MHGEPVVEHVRVANAQCLRGEQEGIRVGIVAPTGLAGYGAHTRKVVGEEHNGVQVAVEPLVEDLGCISGGVHSDDLDHLGWEDALYVHAWFERGNIQNYSCCDESANTETISHRVLQ